MYEMISVWAAAFFDFLFTVVSWGLGGTVVFLGIAALLGGKGEDDPDEMYERYVAAKNKTAMRPIESTCKCGQLLSTCEHISCGEEQWESKVNDPWMKDYKVQHTDKCNCKDCYNLRRAIRLKNKIDEARPTTRTRIIALEETDKFLPQSGDESDLEFAKRCATTDWRNIKF